MEVYRVAKMGRPKSDDPMNYRLPSVSPMLSRSNWKLMLKSTILQKGRCLRKDWNYYTDRISTVKMLLTISEVRGWQNQEKTAGAMCCEPVRVRRKDGRYSYSYTEFR